MAFQRRVARVSPPGFAPFSLRVHPPGELVSDHLVTHGIWEPYESSLFARLVEPGACVVDVGANLGYYTHLAAQRAGPSGRVLAFEPDPGNFALLEHNARTLPGDSVTVRRQALGDRRAAVGLADDPRNKGDVHLRQHGSPAVDMIPGDALALERIDVLKIDTQGWERRVLVGLRETLGRSGRQLRVLVELWPYGLQRAGDSAAGLVAVLLELGLPVWLIDHQAGCLQPLTPPALRELAERVLTVEQQGFVNLLLADARDLERVGAMG